MTDREEFLDGRRKMASAYYDAEIAKKAGEDEDRIEMLLNCEIDQLCDINAQSMAFAAGAMSFWAEEEVGFKVDTAPQCDNAGADTCLCIVCLGDAKEDALCEDCIGAEAEDAHEADMEVLFEMEMD